MGSHEENVEELAAQIQDAGDRGRKLKIVLQDSAEGGEILELTDVHFEGDSNTVIAEVSPG